MKNLLIIAALAICPVFAKAALPTVTDSATNNGSVYLLLSNSTWTDAEAEAVVLGGHLATITSITQNNFVWNLWGTNRDLWIGLTDPTLADGGGITHSNNFIWSSGNTSGFRNWRSGEPNGDDYTYMLAKGLVPEGGVWNDAPNILKNGSEPSFYGVVQLNAVPEPTTSLLFAVGIAGVWMRKRFAAKA